MSMPPPDNKRGLLGWWLFLALIGALVYGVAKGEIGW